MAVINVETVLAPVKEKIHDASVGLRARLNPRDFGSPDPKDTFESVAVIGAAGKTGRFYVETLSPQILVREVFRGSRNIETMLQEKHGAVILATSNLDAEAALKDIAKNVKDPITLILSQNGIGVVQRAEVVLAGVRSQVTIVRASLWTNISDGPDNGIVYNENKKRIDLALVGDDSEDKVGKAADAFREAGFDVRVVGDYWAMETAKVIGNLVGSTAEITGSLETLTDPDIFLVDHRGLKDRFAIADKAGIQLDNLRYMGRLRWLSSVPEWVVTDRGLLGKTFRKFVVSKLASERNNQPPAAAKAINEGTRRVEPTDYYHMPFLRLARSVELESPADAAIVSILRRHERAGNDFSLISLTKDERRNLLLEIYGYHTQDVMIQVASAFGIEYLRIALEAIYHHYTDSLEISGQENLKGVVESLKNGKSVLIAPNHRSHVDHPTIIRALKESLPPEAQKYPMYIVAGMKFDKEEISNRFSRAYSHPVVWTLTQGDSEEVEWKAQIVNGKATKIIENLLSKPCIVVVYLEGGRNKSDDLELQSPAVDSSLWLINPHIELAVPVVIQNTEKMLPPGAKWPQQHADLTVEFCRAIETAPFRVATYQDADLRKSRSERDRRFSGKVLGAIAAKLPDSQRGGY